MAMMKKKIKEVEKCICVKGYCYTDIPSDVLSIVHNSSELKELNEIVSLIKDNNEFRKYVESSLYHTIPLACSNEKARATIVFNRRQSLSLNKYDKIAYGVWRMIERDDARFQDRHKDE